MKLSSKKVSKLSVEDLQKLKDEYERQEGRAMNRDELKTWKNYQRKVRNKLYAKESRQRRAAKEVADGQALLEVIRENEMLILEVGRLRVENVSLRVYANNLEEDVRHLIEHNTRTLSSPSSLLPPPLPLEEEESEEEERVDTLMHM